MPPEPPPGALAAAADPAWQAAMDFLLALEQRPDDAALRARLRRWLAESPAHAAAYAEACTLSELAPQLSPGLAWPSAVAPTRGPTSGMAPRRRLLAGGAALAAAAAGLAWTGWPAPEGLLQTATGEIRLVELADGSRVTLDTGSAIRVDFADGARRVALLRGQAFFAVAPDAARPFTVAIAAAEARVLGTRFALRRGAAELELGVEEGRVGLAFDGRDLTAAAPLTAGARARLDLGNGALRREAVALAAIAPWRQGRLVVERWTVAEVLAELQRYLPARLWLRDAALGAQRVNGSYDLSRPEAAAAAVVETAGGRLRRLTPWLLLAEAR
ncbi:FecR family protein [Roseomonas sp. 18066]|uniref:FecR family protein n=1 Tax=Roseomonas sp. 18066 TaxID=2681412 RepID=UPI00135B2821|nr:FecR domain-containing protein [Roseomonas sp. 18066]